MSSQALIRSLYEETPPQSASSWPDDDEGFVDIVPALWISNLESALRRHEKRDGDAES